MLNIIIAFLAAGLLFASIYLLVVKPKTDTEEVLPAESEPKLVAAKPRPDESVLFIELMGEKILLVAYKICNGVESYRLIGHKQLPGVNDYNIEEFSEFADTFNDACEEMKSLSIESYILKMWQLANKENFIVCWGDKISHYAPDWLMSHVRTAYPNMYSCPTAASLFHNRWDIVTEMFNVSEEIDEAEKKSAKLQEPTLRVEPFS